MAIGNFNYEEYMEKLNEEATAHQGSNDGNLKGDSTEGLIIPAENKKTYDWLKKEYNSAKTEVKVEMKMGGTKFEPGYDVTAGGNKFEEFKPGMYGEIKTSDTEGSKKKESNKGLTSKDGNTKPGEEKKDKGATVKGAGVVGTKSKKEAAPPKKEEEPKEKKKKEKDENEE